MRDDEVLQDPRTTGVVSANDLAIPGAHGHPKRNAVVSSASTGTPFDEQGQRPVCQKHVIPKEYETEAWSVV